MKNKSGFTLVELIVTITILAILGTIGFVSLGNYSTQSRDTQRITNIGIGSKAIQALLAKGGSLPIPDPSRITLYASGTVIGTQGFYGKDVARVLSTSEFSDPLDGILYSYSTNSSGTQFSIYGLLEGKQSSRIPGVDTAFAASTSNRFPYIQGNGVILTMSSGSEKNQPIQNLYNPASFTGVDVILTTTEYAAVTSKREIIIGTGSVLGFVASGGGKDCNDILGKDSTRRGKNGFYWINPDGTKSIQVYCDMTTKGGGWTTITSNLLGTEYGISYTTLLGTGENSGAIITITPTKWGCGMDNPSPSHSIDIAPSMQWKDIQYTQEFHGAASCWSVFGTKNDGGTISVDTNLNPFKIGQDMFLDSTGMTPMLTGNTFPGTWRCDNEMANFWHNNNGFGIRSARLELSKTNQSLGANLHTDASCIDLVTTKWIYKNIQVR